MNTHHNKLHNDDGKTEKTAVVDMCRVCVCVCVCAQLPTSRADQLNSCAAAGCASTPAGDVTANMTVTTNQTRRTAVSICFHQHYQTVFILSLFMQLFMLVSFFF